MKRIRSTIRACLLAIPLLAALPVEANQEIAVRDGGSATITVSARELTRISMAGGGRLSKVWAVPGTMEIQDDKKAGEIFIKPLNVMPGQAFSFFARDDRGATFTLIATAADLPSQSIQLRSTGGGSAPPAARLESSGPTEPHIRRVKALMKALALRKLPHGYQSEELDQPVPVWRETEVRIKERWTGELVGEIWSIRNAGNEDLRFSEEEFKDFYADVVAMAITEHEVRPGDSTEVLILRRGVAR